MSGNLVIGPTNEYQDSKSDRSCDPDRILGLKRHGAAMIRDFDDQYQELCTFSGLRPAAAAAASRHADYQIQACPIRKWITVGAIRSTGLSTSRVIAEYVAGEILGLDTAKKTKADAILPEVNCDGDCEGETEEIKVGTFSFKVTHKLAQLFWLNRKPYETA